VPLIRLRDQRDGAREIANRVGVFLPRARDVAERFERPDIGRIFLGQIL